MRKRVFYGWFIVAALSVINFALHATGTLNLGLFIIPMGNDLGISRSLFGWLTTSRALAGGTSAVLVGRLLDRFGSRLLIPVSALLTGLCLLAMSRSNHVYQLFLIFAIIGIAGLNNDAGTLLTSTPVAKWFIRKRGMALALSSLGMGVGPIVFVPVTQLLIAGLGWRSAWMVLAFISMALIIPLGLIVLRRQPEDMGLLPDGQPPTAPKAMKSLPNIQEEATWTVRGAARTRAFWMLTTAMVLGGLGIGGGVHRIPYWVDVGFDAQLVSLATSVDAAGAAAMILASGVLLDRFAPRFVAAVGYASWTASIVFMLLANSPYYLFASAILNGLGAGIMLTSQTYLWANYYGRSFLGTIRGVTMPATLTAIAIGAPVFGYVFDFTGTYRLAWEILLGVYILAFSVMFLATPPRRKLPALQATGVDVVA